MTKQEVSVTLWRHRRCPCAMHVIGFSDLNDLWVIKTKKAYDPLRAYCVCVSCSVHLISIKNIRKFCLFYSHNNKIQWLSDMTDTFWGKFTRRGKVCGLFFLIVLLGRWLAGQANSGHLENDKSEVFIMLHKFGGMWHSFLAKVLTTDLSRIFIFIFYFFNLNAIQKKQERESCVLFTFSR